MAPVRPGRVPRAAPSGDDAPWGPATAVRRLTERRPLLTDVGLVAGLDLLTAVAPLVHGGHQWWVWLLAQALVLPLVLRRRHPTAVFTVIAAVGFAQWLLGVRVPADAALLVALYTVAAHEPRQRAYLAAGVLELGAVLASVRFAPTGNGVIGSLVFLTGMVTAALFAGTTLRARRAYLASVEDRAARLERERDQQARLAATAERTRIARELHDIVAHSLSVVISLADGAALTNPAQPDRATEAMRQVSRTGRQALTEMRRLLGVLRDDDEGGALAPQPDLSRLDDLITQMRAAGLPIRFAVSGRPRALPATAEATLYRLVQEALTNILKHARDVTQARVALEWADQQVLVTVTNDGQPADAPATDTGHGLTGMRERAALYGGTVTAGPRPGGGWHVHARLPLPEPGE